MRGLKMLFAVGACLLAAGPAVAEVPESPDPIRLAIHDWTGQQITTHLAGEILERMGYNVEYVVAGYIPMFEAIQTGELSASLEIWQFSSREVYQRAIDSGKVIALGDTGIEPREGLVYPTYIKEKCPGLPSWEALAGCAQLFGTPETLPKGRVIDFPADWGPRTAKVIAAFGLENAYTVVPSGSEGNMMAELKSAVARKDGFLMMMWTPHWIWADPSVSMEWVELPPAVDGCDEDPAVGLWPDRTHDCDWGHAWVRKIASSQMQEKWPSALKLLESFKVTNQTQIELLAAVDLDGKTVEEVTAAWVDANEAVWRPWVQQAEQAAAQ